MGHFYQLCNVFLSKWIVCVMTSLQFISAIWLSPGTSISTKSTKHCWQINRLLTFVCQIVHFYRPGNVFYVDESGKATQKFIAEGAIRKLLFYDLKNMLVTVTDNLMLTLHNVDRDGETLESLKVCFTSSYAEPSLFFKHANVSIFTSRHISIKLVCWIIVGIGFQIWR